jgi:ABC-2 type transport system ATP-binding protein
MIELQNVSRSYGRKLAVDRLDLSIRAGEVFAFLGPNGAGKTTTIKMLVGLLRPSSGSIRLCGFDLVTEFREAARRLGYVPDEPFLYDKLTGREFLQFIGGMYGMTKDVIRERIAREIANFELADFLDDLTESYSLGMKQRLVFGAAMLHDPEVLVVDEPMVGLDPRSSRMVKDLLRAKAAAGMTVFMSTHLLSVAEEIADRMAIVDRGRLRCLGTLDELRRDLAQHHTSLEQLFLDATSASPEAGDLSRPLEKESTGADLPDAPTQEKAG